MTYSSIQNMIGNTPLLKIKTPNKEVNLYVKMESCNPTGSIKDRACIYNIQGAVEDGTLTEGKTILDASSGNMACSLAFYGHIMGYKVKVICNSKLTKDKENFLRYYGADVEIFGDFTIDGNLKCKNIMESSGGRSNYCFLDQLHNMNNPRASYHTLAPEIYNKLPNVSAIIGSLGSGGSMLGVARFFKERKPDVKIFTAQAASGTKIPGIGSFIDGDYKTPFIKELEEKKFIADCVLVTSEQAKKATFGLRSQGVFTGYQGGGVLECALRSIDKYNIKGDVVMVIGDSGWKNMDKLMNYE